MAIISLYSKRKAASERAENDVYSYNVIPAELRSQLNQMFDEAYSNSKFGRPSNIYLNFNYPIFEDIIGILRREYGKDKLAISYSGAREELTEFIKSCNTDHFLDCCELYGLLVNSSSQLQDGKKEIYLHELNYRFKEAGIGYEFVENNMMRVDSSVLHTEVLKPTLAIISSNVHYKGAEQEILLAFDKFRHHDNKGAVSDALKAFESTMKTILSKRGWSYGINDPASKLIAACFENGLIPNYMQTHFGALRTMLESGVPTVRNKTSGHGQGSEVKPLDDHYASYVLYTALANMKLLIDCDKALP